MRSTLTHLSYLESEAIEIFREAVSEAENPVMLYSVVRIVQLCCTWQKSILSPPPVSFAACGYYLEIPRDV